MLLKLLADDDPKNQNSQNDAFDPEPDLAAEILMVLSSRPRHYHANEKAEICQSIINYGISDIFPTDLSKTDRNRMLEARLLKALQLFEPRLSNISVSAGNQNLGCSLFIIEAEMKQNPIRLTLEWDDLLCNFLLRV